MIALIRDANNLNLVSSVIKKLISYQVTITAHDFFSDRLSIVHVVE